MGNPKKMLGSSRLPGKSHFSFLHFSCTVVHLAWTSFNCHWAWAQYVLAAVGLCSGWIEAFPCHKADGLTVAKVLENVFPTWGMPSRCSPVAHSPLYATGWWCGTCHCFPLLPLWNGLIILWHVNLWRLPLGQKVSQALLNHLQQKLGSESAENSRSEHSSKFWGVIWLGKNCGVPKAITDKVQGYPIPKEVVVIMRYWWIFMLRLAQCLCPVYHLPKKGYK